MWSAAARSRRSAIVHSAHAGRGDRDVGLRESGSQFRRKDGQFELIFAPLQAFDQTMERPDIVRMLRATLYPAAKAKIVAIDLLGLRIMALLHQQCREGVTRRMHPCPGLGVTQIVVPANGLPQMLVGFLVIALVI